MVHVHGWMADQAGCGYYRIALPLAAIAAATPDLTCTWDPRLPAARADIVLGQRMCMPAPSLRWQDLACEARTRLVLDLDDDLWRIDPQNPAHGAFTPQMLHRLDANLAVANQVTVSTPQLAEIVRQRTSAPVTVVPNAVPDWLATHPRPSRPDRGLTVGWAGSPTHAHDWVALPGLTRALEETGATLHTMGAPPPPGTVSAWASRHSAWIRSVEAFLRAIDFDVMLAPLADTMFNQSKSALRLTEAAALRIPVIASNVGPYADWIDHGVTGLLARRPSDWATHLRALAADPDLREHLAGNAHAKVVREAVISVTAPAWLDAITGTSPAEAVA